jgi:hypothetical protein
VFRMTCAGPIALLLLCGTWVHAEAPLLQVKHSGTVYGIVWSQDGKLLVTAGADGTVRVTSVADGKQIAHINIGKPVSGVALSQDDKQVGVKESIQDGMLSIWDVGTGKQMRKLGFQGYNANQLAFSADALVAAGPGEHMVFNFKGGGYGSRSGRVPAGSFAAVAPRGQIAAWSTPDGNATLFHVEQRRFTQRVNLGNAKTMAFTPDAQSMAVGSDDKYVRLLDVSGKEANGKEIRKFDGLREPATRLSFSGNGKVLAAASDKDPVIRIWEVTTGRLIRRLTACSGVTTAMALAPDGKSVAVASGDKVIVWNVATRVLGELGPAVALSADELKASWTDLANPDYNKAEAAFKKIATAGNHSLDFIRNQVRTIAVPPIDWKRVDKLLDDLDDPAYAVRRKATVELSRLGELIQVPLQEFMVKGPSLEAERRAGRLLDRIRDPELTPDRLRTLEAIEILELLRTPESKQLLEELARDVLIAQLRTAAREALDRLKRAADSKADQ